MKNTGFFPRMTALLCMAALLCGLAGCGALKDILGGGETEPTQDGGQVPLVIAEPMQIYESPDPAAQIVGIVPENTQVVIVQTVRGFTADGADALWGQLLHEVGWVILRTEGEPPSVDPDLTPTQPQEPTIYNTKLLPLSASHIYTRQEILDALQMWLEAGYTLDEALGLARNEIYADHGYCFADPAYTRYFYTDRAELYGAAGTLSAQQAQQCMTECQQKNIATLQDMEAQLELGDDFVTDLEDPSIASSRYHLPYIHAHGYEAVNQKIQAELLPMAREEGWDDIGYAVGQSGDVVTILVRCDGFSDDSAYYTYHFDRSTGELLERADVLRQFGLDTQTFLKLAEERALAYFESCYQWMQEESDQTRGMYEELREITSERTLDNTLVFIDRNGNLGFVARIGAIAGATYDNQVLGCWEDAPVEDVTFPQ